MAKGFGIILVFVLLSVILIVGYQYMTSSLAATDVGAQNAVNGTQYQAAYNASRDTTITAVKFHPLIIYIIGGFSVLVTLATLVLMATKKKQY